MEHGERGCNHLSKLAGSQRTSYMSHPQTERVEEEGGRKKRQVSQRKKKNSLELLAGNFKAGQYSEPHPDPSLTHSHTPKIAAGQLHWEGLERSGNSNLLCNYT